MSIIIVVRYKEFNNRFPKTDVTNGSYPPRQSTNYLIKTYFSTLHVCDVPRVHDNDITEYLVWDSELAAVAQAHADRCRYELQNVVIYCIL